MYFFPTTDFVADDPTTKTGTAHQNNHLWCLSGNPLKMHKLPKHKTEWQRQIRDVLSPLCDNLKKQRR